MVLEIIAVLRKITLEAGWPWTGSVRNWRGNGNFYLVVADVARIEGWPGARYRVKSWRFRAVSRSYRAVSRAKRALSRAYRPVSTDIVRKRAGW
jgi:hypothetical protein